MADAPTAGAARYASVAEVRADVERAGGDASGLCGFGRCFCVKAAPGISGRKERGQAAAQPAALPVRPVGVPRLSGGRR